MYRERKIKFNSLYIIQIRTKEHLVLSFVSSYIMCCDLFWTYYWAIFDHPGGLTEPNNSSQSDALTR